MIDKLTFLAFSDLHDNWDFLDGLNLLKDKVDFVVFLGDISEHDVSLAKELSNLIDYYVPGNVDTPEMEKLLFSKHIDGKNLRYSKYRISAIGYSNPTPFNTPGERSEEDLYDMGTIVRPNDILFTHAPPKGIMDRIPSGMHVGSEGLRKIVDEKPPMIHLFGHIHEEIGVEKRKNSIFVNLPPAYNNQYALVTLGDSIPKVEFLKMSS